MDSCRLGSSTASTFPTLLRNSRRESLEGSPGPYMLWRGAVTDSWSSISYKKITGLGMSSKGTSRSEFQTGKFQPLDRCRMQSTSCDGIIMCADQGRGVDLSLTYSKTREKIGEGFERGMVFCSHAWAHRARVLLMGPVMIIYLARQSMLLQIIPHACGVPRYS